MSRKSDVFNINGLNQIKAKTNKNFLSKSVMSYLQYTAIVIPCQDLQESAPMFPYKPAYVCLDQSVKNTA